MGGIWRGISVGFGRMMINDCKPNFDLNENGYRSVVLYMVWNLGETLSMVMERRRCDRRTRGRNVGPGGAT